MIFFLFMAISLNEQFQNTLSRSERPVIVLRHEATVDDFTAAFALSSFIKKLYKNCEIVTTGGKAPNSLNFLNNETVVRGDFYKLNKLTLELNTLGTKVDELSYKEENGKLAISLIPKSGTWQVDDVAIRPSGYRHDLIITIGARDLNSIGQLFDQYQNFFFETPIVNIDFDPANEYFGQINLVNINSNTCSEVCFDLLTRLDENIIDEKVATFLLAGMIHRTKSFKVHSVTPKTLKSAGKLMARGAKREEIVRHLYKTRSVETLRLWGRALSRLKAQDDLGLIWTLITKQDVVNAGASIHDLPHIIDELMTTTPNAKVIVLIYENGTSVEARVHAEKPYDVLLLTAGLSGSGSREDAHIHTKKEDIVEAEKLIIETISKKLAQ
jgi:nanoRNase/pAp phosphatase (c-di-AMP/oligoRNAs hydrolase)